jgi:hypothetical protein
MLDVLLRIDPRELSPVEAKLAELLREDPGLVLGDAAREVDAADGGRPVFRVVVTREGDDWLADVPALEGAHTFARSMAGLDRAVREVVVMAADLPDAAMPDLQLDWSFDTGDVVLDTTAAGVRSLREHAEKTSTAATARTVAAARRLTAGGLGVRDTAVVLGVSPQRISQIVAQPKAG